MCRHTSSSIVEGSHSFLRWRQCTGFPPPPTPPPPTGFPLHKSLRSPNISHSDIHTYNDRPTASQWPHLVDLAIGLDEVDGELAEGSVGVATVVLCLHLHPVATPLQLRVVQPDNSCHGLNTTHCTAAFSVSGGVPVLSHSVIVVYCCERERERGGG